MDNASAIGDAAQNAVSSAGKGVDQARSFFGDGFKKMGDTVTGWMKSIF